MTSFQLHFLFEALAYAVGFRFFLHLRKRDAAALADKENALVIGVGAIVGAALGAKIAWMLYDPVSAFADFPDWRHLLGGKSIIGALLGGLLGVETAKRAMGIRASTGDAFALPLMLGIFIGRIGCFLAGLDDGTYGNATSLPWGVDFGDGIPRHPTQIYEEIFLALWAMLLIVRGKILTQTGDRFRVFLIGYLIYRLLIEWIRPMPMIYLGVFSGLQLLCIAGLLYYHRDIPRLTKELLWARK
ncbi:MAG: prolipoprotein diacylglyceryl transferase [Methylobacillus sp.]|nr:prolipoprotein diacylglyceryl transferase [Methylobacillus sp.]